MHLGDYACVRALHGSKHARARPSAEHIQSHLSFSTTGVLVSCSLQARRKQSDLVQQVHGSLLQGTFYIEVARRRPSKRIGHEDGVHEVSQQG